MWELQTLLIIHVNNMLITRGLLGGLLGLLKIVKNSKYNNPGA